MTAEGVIALAARDLVKEYRQGPVTERVLDGVSFDVTRGRFVSIMGPSGSGKSTLLHLLGGLDRPDAGQVVLDDTLVSGLTDDQRSRLRRRHIGIVYQFFNLVPVLTAEENIALPAVIAGQRESAYRQKLADVIELVGLADHRHKRPDQLSGGQQQRAAIARALFIEPAVLLADEPTGNLDLRSGSEILALFVEAQRLLGQTIVMVTHDPRSAAHGEEVLLLRDGAMAGRLELIQRCRGAARTDRTHEGRARAVLRWLEQLDAGAAASGVEARVEGRAAVRV
jgi:putative ABC transport system ATP-binding protein